MNTLSVFDYTNYVEYLNDFFAQKNAEKNGLYTHQYIANKLGIKHKMQVFRILRGERKRLSKDLIRRFCEICGLEKNEDLYFQNLVAFNEASSLEDKNFYYEEMHRIIRPVRKYKLRRREYEYLANWYTPVLREIITMNGWDGDLKTLGDKVKPKLSVKETAAAVKNLETLGLVSKKDDKYELREPSLTPGNELAKLAGRNYQKQHFRLVEDALPLVGKQEYKITTATFGVNQYGIELIKKRITEIHRELVDLMAQFDDDKDQVYQFNMQLFPLSKRMEDDEA